MMIGIHLLLVSSSNFHHLCIFRWAASSCTSPSVPPTLRALNALLCISTLSFSYRARFFSFCRLSLLVRSSLVSPIRSLFPSPCLMSRGLPRLLSLCCAPFFSFQSERDRVLYDFKEGRSLILVATDVASRGLDVKDIHMVVNFDFPQEMEVNRLLFVLSPVVPMCENESEL